MKIFMKTIALMASMWLGLMVQVAVATSVIPPNTSADFMKAYATELNYLQTKAQLEGSVRVIVRLKKPTLSTNTLSPQAALSDERAQIAKSQQRILTGTQLSHPKSVKKFNYSPFIAMQVDSDTLDQLRASPEVEAVTEDVMVRAYLTESVPLIGGTQAWQKGFSGAGQTVAILDTGVDKSHPFLAGKMVSEACFSTNEFDNFYASACPNGQQQQVGAGAGKACAAEDCIHGTHVAGIAAGRNGVAKDAKLISVQVFTLVTSSSYCGLTTPCISAFYSDIIKGLEYVYSQRNNFKIASVNLSLGDTFKYPGTCDGDPVVEPVRQVVERLRSAGIATVFASGNSTYKDGMGRPACLSNVVSVGATDKQDFVAYFSNTSPALKLFAPGVNIVSSVPGGLFESLDGTSMAAPHVAGAWAVLKSKNPNASVSTILDALTRSGKPLRDYFAGTTKPRIQLAAALDVLSGKTSPSQPVPPGPLTLLSPSGAVNTTTPAYRWLPDPKALWYSVYVYDQAGKQVGFEFAFPSIAGCGDGKTACSVRQSLPLPAGQRYTWKVSALIGFSGEEAVSGTMSFTTPG
jgi:subtilisin family serine protease